MQKALAAMGYDAETLGVEDFDSLMADNAAASASSFSVRSTGLAKCEAVNAFASASVVSCDTTSWASSEGC